MNVLVVDDSAAQRRALSAMLTVAGYAVERVGSAAEAFQALDASDPRSIDLILMDLNMPEVSGIEACRRIRATQPWADLPIIMVTSSEDVDDLSAAFGAGATDYVTKPPNETELLARVRAALALKREMDRRKARERQLEGLNGRLARQTDELTEAREALLAMNRDLERRVSEHVDEIVRRAKEVEVLNAQLRAQVQERSRELAAALGQLSRHHEGGALLPPGTHIGGRVRILRPLARGGMGQVYLAEDLLTGRVVAVKLLRPYVGRDRGDLYRFLDEARAAASVDHPAIVKTIHIDVSRDGQLFQVMEYVAGQTLSARLAENAPLAPDVCAALGAVVAEALAAAHRAGVIHRDIKPDNLMLSVEPPGVRILDFGISKIRQAEHELRTALTPVGWLLGTPGYASPEQIQDPAGVTPASDVYSLGAVLYEMATGRPPFSGTDARTLALAQAAEEPQPVRERVPQFPESLAGLIDRCLHRAPDARPTARDLAAELGEMASTIDEPPSSVAASGQFAASRLASSSSGSRSCQA